jgi:hypothetical protein
VERPSGALTTGFDFCPSFCPHGPQRSRTGPNRAGQSPMCRELCTRIYLDVCGWTGPEPDVAGWHLNAC